MKDHKRHGLSFDDWDEARFPRAGMQEFDRVVERAISRRGFLGGVLAFGSGAAAMGGGALRGSTALAQGSGRFPFGQIAAQTDGTIHVPEGYGWQVLVRWGDPLFSDAPVFSPETGIPTQGSDRVFGENTDGMELFSIDGREILVVNSEYANTDINLAGSATATATGPEGVRAAGSAEDVLRLQNFQGVTVMEVAQGADGWSVVVDSPYNRRITHSTPMAIDGPAAGHPLLRTAADPSGMRALGTFNNCGSGRTPWGTYLTCEENFNGYFGATGEMPADAARAAGHARYGLAPEGWGYDYHLHDSRFDMSRTPNEPHRAGWIVEIDPRDATSTPVKHTALGRFKHENAACVLAGDGRLVVYMGDDERGEFLYKWVSRDPYAEGGDSGSLLVEGQLYAATFAEDQTGRWVALTPEATGMDPAGIAIFTRIAASAAGATTMDRPEWIAVNPLAPEAYCCLTNNTKRGMRDEAGGILTNAGGDPMAVNAPNPRETNEYGQILRWRPEGGDHGHASFAWDLYVMAGNPAVHRDGPLAGTRNINAGNLFNSPDGMQIDSTGLIWIQTDGDDGNEGAFAGMGNNQMLAGDPETGEIRRFLTGPKGSEVTGLTWSSDRRTMFVGIQHPAAPFPDGAGRLPRSSIVAVRRDDGAPVG